MLIVEGAVKESEMNMESNKSLVRPPEMAHKDFMLMQKGEWTGFHRIVLGRWKKTYHLMKEIEWWCNANVKDRWFHSEGNEVYYFEDENSALYFKLKWFSDITN
jgi:hypothetical protein